MNDLDLFLETLQTSGLPGLFFGLVVLLAVYFAKRGGLVVTGDQARLANILLSVILSGLDPNNLTSEKAITAAIASLVSALTFTGFEALQKWLTPTAEPLTLNIPQPK